MADDPPRKTAVIEPDVHAAVKVLSALHGESLQKIINDAVRAQYDVEKLSNLNEEVLQSGEGGGGTDLTDFAESADSDAEGDSDSESDSG